MLISRRDLAMLALERLEVVALQWSLLGRAVEKAVPLSSAYSIQWGGQFENFERAQKRLAVVVPVVIAIIFGMLLWMFQNFGFAFAVFALVPLSLLGGMLGRQTMEDVYGQKQPWLIKEIPILALFGFRVAKQSAGGLRAAAGLQ